MQDTDIDTLEASLRSARLTARNSRNVQDDLFDQHATLLSAYRELRESQQPSADSSSSSNEAPLILLLVDANTCHFHDELLKRRQKGGRDAAELLYQEVLSVGRKRKVPTSTCQIKIKCYGDLAELSRGAFRRGVAGNEGRSLSPFFFGFSSAFTGCEFVDVGEDVYERIAENVALYQCLTSCRHIIVAARPTDDAVWGRIAPRSMEHARQTTVITRREGATVPMKRGFPVEEFADIFDWSDLYPLRRSPDYGSRARRSMVTTPDNIRDQQSGDISGSPPRKGKSRIYSSQPPSSMEPRRQGMIPVNILGQRVDPPMPRLEDQAIERYHSIRPRPCNNMHLFGGCNDPDCTFDHNPIDEEVLGVMRMQLRFYSCKEKSACRKSGCLNSHMCQRCRGFDKKPGCRFPSSFHGMKTTVVDMVPAADLEVTEGGSNIAMPMPSSFADTERVDEAAAPREPGAGSEQDVVEQAVEVAVERGNAGQMNLLDFSDDE